MAQTFVSVVAHFFVVVGGSKFHDRLAHFFIDIYKETPGLDPATVDAVIKIMDDYIVADIANEK